MWTRVALILPTDLRMMIMSITNEGFLGGAKKKLCNLVFRVPNQHLLQICTSPSFPTTLSYTPKKGLKHVDHFDLSALTPLGVLS